MISKIQRGQGANGRSEGVLAACWSHSVPRPPSRPGLHAFNISFFCGFLPSRKTHGDIEGIHSSKSSCNLNFICFNTDLTMYTSFFPGSFLGIFLPKSLCFLFYIYHTPAHCSIHSSHITSSLRCLPQRDMT